MPLQLTDHIARVENLMTAPIGDDIVIFSLVSDNYIALDDIGRRIWDLIETPIPIDTLCRQLTDEFSGEPESIESDVLAFLDELQTEGIAHVVADGSA